MPLCKSIIKPLCLMSSNQLNSATCFNKWMLKMASGAHLNEESSYLTTFNTHHGSYHFMHMSYGLKMSQDVCQMCIDLATDCLPSIIAIHDDKYQHLLQLMKTTKQHGITFASKTLTDVETHYANIERVSVSVLQPHDVPHIPIWQACHCTKWP